MSKITTIFIYILTPSEKRSAANKNGKTLYLPSTWTYVVFLSLFIYLYICLCVSFSHPLLMSVYSYVGSFKFYAVWQHFFAAMALFAMCWGKGTGAWKGGCCVRKCCCQVLALPKNKTTMLARNCFGFVCATFANVPLLPVSLAAAEILEARVYDGPRWVGQSVRPFLGKKKSKKNLKAAVKWTWKKYIYLYVCMYKISLHQFHLLLCSNCWQLCNFSNLNFNIYSIFDMRTCFWLSLFMLLHIECQVFLILHLYFTYFLVLSTVVENFCYGIVIPTAN